MLQPTGFTTTALIKLIYEVTTTLESNHYVIVYAIDFSKAFYTVRHSELHHKCSKVELSDYVCKWLVDFYQAHTHTRCSLFGGLKSEFTTTLVSTVKRLAAGPVSYVVTRSDLRPLTPDDSMVKFADDTYMVVPAWNHGSCEEEIKHVGDWASSNNMSETVLAQITFT